MAQSMPLLPRDEENPHANTSEQEQSLPLLEKEEGCYDHDHPLSWQQKQNILGQAISRLEAVRMGGTLTIVRRFGYAFVPQLLRSILFNDALPHAKIHTTSWLDGFRGLAALAVYNLHFFVYYTDTKTPYGEDDNHLWIFQLPILRLFYAGSEAVLVFFLVAGYAISYRSLQLMSRPDDAASQKSLYFGLSASIFRRFLRLYLPCLVITLISAVTTWLGAQEPLRPWTKDSKRYFLGPANFHQGPRYSSLFEQLGSWVKQFWKMMSVWQYEVYYPQLDSHLWTIRIEFRASLALYVALIALGPCRIHVRFALLLLLSIYCGVWDRWPTQLFFWGACLAQFDVWKNVRQRQRGEQQQKQVEEVEQGASNFSDDWATEKPEVDDTLPIVQAPGSQSSIRGYLQRAYKHIPSPRYTIYNLIWTSVCLSSLFMISSGYVTFYEWIPKSIERPATQIQAIGGSIFIACLILADDNSLSHKILNWWFIQYLGKIVFSLYLVHGPLLHAGLYATPYLLWAAVGYGFPVEAQGMGAFPYALGVGLGWAINLVIVLWAADVFYREVEERMRRVMYWIQGACFNKKS